VIRGVLADAGPLYAAADEGDAHHNRARRELQKLEDERREIIVAYPTLLETHALVLAHMGTNAASRWLSYMSDAATVNPSPEDYRQAITRVRALPDQTITLFDATVATLAVRLGLDVWTYDHHFDVMRVRVWR
jgi:predicted nucleic acid-binding protein